MPKRDGYEVAAYVKSRPKLAHIPVVLLTGAFEPIDQARAAAAGSSDVLAKPFEPQMVINRVKELLGRKRPDELPHSSPEGLSHAIQPQMGDPQPAGREAGTDSPQSASLDDYFDQLDAAFSNLQPGAPPSNGSDEVDWPADLATAPAAVEPAPVAANTPVPPTPVAEGPAYAAAAFGADVSAGFAQGASADKAGATANAPSAPIAPVAPVAPVTPVAQQPALATPVAPQLAAAPTFAADAATAGKPIAPVAPSIAPVPPAPAKPSVNPFANLTAAKAEAAARPVVISDEVIEDIVSRVLQRMSDNVVRETVTDIVSQTAERLVQEEIERIRSES
jgi:hypothetical protein